MAQSSTFRAILRIYTFFKTENFAIKYRFYAYDLLTLVVRFEKS